MRCSAAALCWRLGLGMGVPLLVIGSSGAHLLPRAGAWMNNVKAVFGVLLLGVAVWLLERVVPAQMTLLLWALAGDRRRRVSRRARSFAAPGLGSAVESDGRVQLHLRRAAADRRRERRERSAARRCRCRASGARAQRDAASSQRGAVEAVRGVAALEAELAAAEQAGKPVALDFYADWCISCKVMERNVFSEPAVAAQLGRFQLLQADVTSNDALDQELLQHFGLFGPPSMLFFGARWPRNQRAAHAGRNGSRRVRTPPRTRSLRRLISRREPSARLAPAASFGDNPAVS